MKPGVGCSEPESTAKTALRSPSPTSCHPRQRTRSPSSHSTVRPPVPPAPSDSDKFIWWTPRQQSGCKGQQRPWRALQISFHRIAVHASVAAAKACGGSVMMSTSETRWSRSPHGGRYLAASAKKQRAPWGLCEVRPGCSRLSVDATLRRYCHRIQHTGEASGRARSWPIRLVLGTLRWIAPLWAESRRGAYPRNSKTFSHVRAGRGRRAHVQSDARGRGCTARQSNRSRISARACGSVGGALPHRK